MRLSNTGYIDGGYPLRQVPSNLSLKFQLCPLLKDEATLQCVCTNLPLAQLKPLNATFGITTANLATAAQV